MTPVIAAVIKIICAIAVGILAGHGAVYVFNRIPAEWLCDYGQEPSEELKNTYIQRVKGYPWKLVLSGFFAVIGINMALYDWQFAAAAVVLCWALTEIGIADKKYGIIPDQFVILTAVAAIGLVPWHGGTLEPLWGALAGFGIMMAVSLLGKLIFKKEALGFGDVKLMASIGLALGFDGVLTVMILSCISSALVFAFLLIRKRVKRDDMVPLGPCICGSAIFYVAFMCPLL